MQGVSRMKEVKIIDILMSLLKENDNNLNLRGGRGYSVGHPVPIKKRPRPAYGEINQFEEEEEQNKKPMPVKISRAFKKKGG